MIANNINELKIGVHYSESDVLSLNVKSLNNRGLNYLILEKNANIYFFERVSNDLYFLFDIISQEEYASVS